MAETKPKAKKTSTETKTTKIKKTTVKKTSEKKTVDTKTTKFQRKPFVKVFSKSPSATNLVLVESPAKGKTIKGFLGSEFDVEATMGHVIDLPSKGMGIDIEKNFEPTYEVIPEKKKFITDLKKHASNYAKIWLATDEDREGEAIARHVAQSLGLDIKKTPRIVFHEITKTAIQHALEKYRTIDTNLVDAQQGRRILDRVVGFTVSPVLRNKIQRGLSAGRVQSVAVKLIVEKEREIQGFNPEEFRKLKADLVHKKEILTIELAKINGKKIDIKNNEEVKKILSSLGIIGEPTKQEKEKKSGFVSMIYQPSPDFVLNEIEKKDSKKSPPAPFITSTLQQTASSKLGRGVKQVMMVAQKLYENGFITYMRTDSTNLSALAIGTCSEFIKKKFGENYLKNRQYKSKSANAQEAHEAIRPTYIEKTPSQSGLSDQELKLYDLIWRRTVATQMADAQLESTIYHFSPIDIDHDWQIKGEVIVFDGFMKLYEKADAEDAVLPLIDQGTTLNSNHLLAEQNFTKPPARYTEASLVKALEAKGIGRPSTYAPTISTIQDRGYVEKKEKKLFPTDIAFVVNDYLEKYFKELMNYEFTANLEKKLDDIANGDIEWQKMMKEFYKSFKKELEEAGQGQREAMPVGKKCPKCKEGDLVYKFGKTGKFVGCSRYPDCDFIEETQEEKDKLSRIKEKYEGQPCPAGGTIVVRMGRFGPFLSSSLYPEVKRIQSVPDPKIEALEKKFGGKKCEQCGKGTMHVKKSKRGPFLACDRYPECKNASTLPKEATQEPTEESIDESTEGDE